MMLGIKANTWPHWLQIAVLVPHGILQYILFWIWWPKSDKGFLVGAALSLYLLAFYFIFLR